MENEKISPVASGLIWFGASVSIAEILTGTAIAPLGLVRGALAIVIGHLIGCLLMFFAGLIGAKTERSSMETVRISFGRVGAGFFAIMNVLQLTGWTAVMTGQGAGAAASAAGGFGNSTIWAAIIGIFILIWIILGITKIEKLNIVVMAALFILTLLLSIRILSAGSGALALSGTGGDALSFGAAVELSAAMPISWLPLISDYTRKASHPVASTAVSVIVYFAGSCWMFFIGMIASIFTGASDIPAILVAAGFGVAGLVIVLLSTITTTFLDAYSAGVSTVTINSSVDEQFAAIIVTIAGTLLAIFVPVDNFQDFLYLIGSVFAPMIAILIADVFLLHRDNFDSAFNLRNAVIWVAGFAAYRWLLTVETPVGSTLPTIVLVLVLCVIFELLAQIFGGSGRKVPDTPEANHSISEQYRSGGELPVFREDEVIDLESLNAQEAKNAGGKAGKTGEPADGATGEEVRTSESAEPADGSGEPSESPEGAQTTPADADTVEK